MENVAQTSSPSRSSAARSRRMAIQAPPPDFEFYNAPDAVQASPSPTTPVPPSPPVPPRSPLRPSAKSVASFTTFLEHYTNRDTLCTMPDRMSRRNSTTFSAILDAYSATLPPTPAADKTSFVDEEKPLPPPPEMESPPASPVDIQDALEPFPDAPPPPAAPPVSKRTHAMHELLMSERAYCSDLAFIRDVHIPLALGRRSAFQFNVPLSPPASSGSSSRTLSTASDSSTASEPTGAPMTREDTKTIFGNIAELAVFSDMLSDHLEEALGSVLDGGQGEDHVGKLFLEIIPRMEPLYKHYITRHPAAINHLNSMPQTPALAKYLHQTQTLAAAITHAWDLPSLLIKPVQRLLKYSLLLSTIIEETPECHGDKENLRKARDKMEEVARAVNEGRRRMEVVKEVLTGKSEGPQLKKKMSINKTAQVSMGRMKGMRLSKPKEGNGESESVELLENRLKQSDAFIRDFAKAAVQWSKSVQSSTNHLRAWAQEFANVLGLSENQSSDAFNAFLCIIDEQLLPLCAGLKTTVQEELLPALARLIDTMKAPTRLLAAMHSLEPLHHSLLNLNFSKARPPPALMEASQRFVALRAQLNSELPTYLRLLDKGIVACICQFTSSQTQFWGDVRDRWGELWDALRIEGETNAGSEETLRLWWDRFREVDEAVSKLRIFSRDTKVYSRSHYSRSSGAVSSLGSPFHHLTSLPDSPSFNASGSSSRHRSIGSMDTWSLERKASTESLSSRRTKSRPRTPEEFGRHKTRSNTSPYPIASTSSPPYTQHSQSSPYQRGREDPESYEARGRTRSPSFRRRLSESLRAPLRRSPSVKSTNSAVSSTFAPDPDIAPPLPSISSTVSRDSPTMYFVKVIHSCEVPGEVSYQSLPFFELRRGDMFEVVLEGGHPSTHEDLPLQVDDVEDTLLIVRNRFGDLGWALASFLVPIY